MPITERTTYRVDLDDTQARGGLAKLRGDLAQAGTSASAFGGGVQNLGKGISDLEPKIGKAATAVSGMAGALGPALGSTNAWTGAIANVAGALAGGGPFALGIAGAVLAVGGLTYAFTQSSEQAKKLKEESDRLSRELRENLSATVKGVEESLKSARDEMINFGATSAEMKVFEAEQRLAESADLLERLRGGSIGEIILPGGEGEATRVSGGLEAMRERLNALNDELARAYETRRTGELESAPTGGPFRFLERLASGGGELAGDAQFEQNAKRFRQLTASIDAMEKERRALEQNIEVASNFAFTLENKVLPAQEEEFAIRRRLLERVTSSTSATEEETKASTRSARSTRARTSALSDLAQAEERVAKSIRSALEAEKGRRQAAERERRSFMFLDAFQDFDEEREAQEAARKALADREQEAHEAAMRRIEAQREAQREANEAHLEALRQQQEAQRAQLADWSGFFIGEGVYAVQTFTRAAIDGTLAEEEARNQLAASVIESIGTSTGQRLIGIGTSTSAEAISRLILSNGADPLAAGALAYGGSLIAGGIALGGVSYGVANAIAGSGGAPASGTSSARASTVGAVRASSSPSSDGGGVSTTVINFGGPVFGDPSETARRLVAEQRRARGVLLEGEP